MESSATLETVVLELSETLLTYLVHSTILIGAVAVFLRLAPIRSNPLREVLWTSALCGGFVTALLQTGGAIETRTWTLGLEHLAPASASIERTNAGEPLLLEHSVSPASAARTDVIVPRVAAAEPSALATVGRAARFWPLAWILGALIAAFALGRALLRQRGWLARRVVLDDPAWTAALESLQQRLAIPGRVLLSRADGLPSPVAFGVLRPEICVPTRALLELTPAQQHALLAHELAHLKRGDPLRLLLARAAEAIGFFQPLNRLARRRLFEVAEQRCDALAIVALGSGVALAECLTEVASWWTASSVRRPVLAMAGSPLGARVEKLLAADDAVAADRRRRRLAPALYLFIPSLAALVPAVSIAANRADAPVPPRHALRSVVPGLIDEEVMAVELLVNEIDALTNEVTDLRAELTEFGLVGAFADEVDQIERRVARLNERRALLTAWRERRSREAGLAAPRIVEDPPATSPRSEQR